jgi:hypothetical protein
VLSRYNIGETEENYEKIESAEILAEHLLNANPEPYSCADAHRKCSVV